MVYLPSHHFRPTWATSGTSRPERPPPLSLGHPSLSTQFSFSFLHLPPTIDENSVLRAILSPSQRHRRPLDKDGYWLGKFVLSPTLASSFPTTPAPLWQIQIKPVKGRKYYTYICARYISRQEWAEDLRKWLNLFTIRVGEVWVSI